MEIKPIKFKRINKTRNAGIFYSPKKDMDVLVDVCNELIAKVDELTDEVNRLRILNNKD